MTITSNGTHFQTEQSPEQLQSSSPTRRVAAYHSETILVARSQAFLDVMNHVERIANTHQPVLVTGESPVVKELVACAIHQRGDRRDHPFVMVNCGAIPAQLLESELFGSVEETFGDRRRLYEEADGGTIFLDEITKTTSSFQAELLRVLQTGQIRRVGSNDAQSVNVRVIAGSNRNLEQDVAAGKFCNDLFQRLSAVSIMLPQCAPDYAAQQSATGVSSANDDWVTLSVIEGRYVARVLEHTGGNKQAAARVLAVDRKTLDRMIKRHHIDCHRVPRARIKVSGTN